MVALFAFTAALIPGAQAAPGVPAPGPEEQILKERVSAIEAKTGGVLGVAVMDLRTGREWSYRGLQAFPMQSVFKLPLAAVVLSQVDRKKISLSERVTITKHDLSIPHSPLAEEFKGPRQVFTIRTLLEKTLLESDNTAADLLLRRVGGPSVATAALRQMGVRSIRIDRMERDLNTAYAGLGKFRPEWSQEEAVQKALAALPEEQKSKALHAWMEDPQDTATPSGSVEFLAKLYKGTLLSPSSTQLILTWMAQTKTAPGRVRAGLPPAAIWRHRSGTGRRIAGIIGAANNIGIASFPDGRQLAIAVYLKGSRLDSEQTDRELASVARVLDASFR